MKTGEKKFDEFEELVLELDMARIIFAEEEEEEEEEEARIVVSIKDITERKQAEIALHQSEENFRHSLDDAPMGIRIVTVEGETIYANRVILDIYGYDSVEELKTTPVKNRYTPQSYAEFKIRREKRKRGDDDPSEYEISIVRKDGEVRHLQVFRKEILWNGERQFQVIYQDVTERKQAEEKLQEKTHLNQILLDAFPCVALLLRPQTREIIASNNAAVKVGAFPGAHCFSTWGQRQDPCPWCLAPALLATGEAQHLEVEALGIFWDAHWIPVAEDLYMHFAFDITERKQAEEALRKSEDLLNTTQHLTKVGGWEWNVEKQAMYWTEETYMIHDFVPGEIEPGSAEHIARSTECYDTEDRPVILAAFQRCLEEGQPYDFDFPFTSVKGRRLWIRTTAQPVLESGKVISIIGNIMDITDRKKTEEALKESEERFRRLFEKSMNAVALHEIVLNDNGKPVDYVFLMANSGFEVHTGLRVADILGKRVTQIHPGIGKTNLIETYGKVALTGEPVAFDLFFEPAQRHYNVTAYQVGKYRFATIFEDITERKQAEEKLRTSRLQLRALAERLQQIREEERLLVSRDIHDVIGGGLTGLKMDLSWLTQNVKDAESDEEQAAFKSKILISSEFVDHLIKETRRISTGLRPPFIDDLGLISSIDWQLSEFTSRTGILHELTTQFEYLNMEKDKVVGVFRMFQEALTNIVRHSRATKVVVVLREDERSLFGDEKLVLEIRDNGRGITEDEIMNSKSLGLLGMKERAMVFGGEFSIRGEHGRGTVVYIKIPRKKGEQV